MSFEEKISYITWRSGMYACVRQYYKLLGSHFSFGAFRILHASFSTYNVVSRYIGNRVLIEETVCTANVSLYGRFIALPMVFFRQGIINDKFALWNRRRDWKRAGVNKSYVTIALVISAKFSIFISKSIYFYIFVAIAKVQCSVPFVILGKILIAALHPICIFTAGNFFDFLIFPLRSPCD